MGKSTFMFGFAAVAALSAGGASAQSGYGGNTGYGNTYGSNNGIVRCESRDGRLNRCGIGGGDAQLVKQVSDADCVRGRTWGTDGNGLWVTEGCRGEFQVVARGSAGPMGQIFRCESTDNRNRQCAIPARGDVRLVRQLSSSRCVEGQSWGRNGNGVWVTDGCRAEFQVMAGNDRRWNKWHNNGSGNNGNDNGYGYGYGQGNGYGNGYGQGNQQSLTCESRENRTSHCSADIRRGAQLVRQLSSSACVEGRSWGWDRSGVWVSGGCRAEFSVW